MDQETDCPGCMGVDLSPKWLCSVHTRRGYRFELTQGSKVTQINTLDQQGLWITAYDDQGMETEVTIMGLSPEVLIDWLRSDGHIR
jgi:hypothetical protein